MFYGITSFIKSLFLRGALSGIIYFSVIELAQKPYDQHIHLLYLILTTIFIERVAFYAFNWKYIILPYSLNMHNTFKSDNNKRSFFIDKFIGFKKTKQKSLLDQVRCKDLDNFTLEYRNFVAIDIDQYRKNTEYILHFLKLIDKRYEVKVYHNKDRHVILSFYKLPYEYTIDYSYFKSGQLFLGMHEKGLYYRSLDTLDHFLVVGESGSGKSNFMQLLNINIMFNLHKFSKIYMVDLKGGVELKRYEHIENVEFVSKVDYLNTLLDLVIEELDTTQKLMLETNQRKLDCYTMIIFDEIGAISVYPDKKLRDQIFNKLALLAMQGRASGILLFLFGQKIDTTILPSNIVNNLQTRVLLKTSNDYNINIIDLKDNIRENITWIEVQDFNRGRAIIKDGLTSEKSLLQFPLITDSFLNSIINSDMKKISLEFASLQSPSGFVNLLLDLLYKKCQF